MRLKYDFFQIALIIVSIIFFVLGIMGLILPIIPGFLFLVISFIFLFIALPKLKKNHFIKKYIKKKQLNNEEFFMKLFVFLIIKFLLIFLVIAIIRGNHEFVYYDLIILPLVLFTYFIHKQLKLHLPVFIMVCLIFLMHAGGGVIHINGIRLYDIFFSFIKYDQIVHFFGSFIIVFVVYSLIQDYLYKNQKKNEKNLFLILVLMTAGVGTLIEMVELIGVLFFNAAAGVGGYMNNAIDLAVNLLGGIVGSLVVTSYHNKKIFGKIINGKV